VAASDAASDRRGGAFNQDADRLLRLPVAQVLPGHGGGRNGGGGAGGFETSAEVIAEQSIWCATTHNSNGL